MVTDGLTKALSFIKHKNFVEMTKIEDQKERLASIKREDDLKDVFQQRGANHSKAFGFETNTF